MLNKLYLSFEFIRNMGLRYVSYRIWYEFQKRTGILKRRFPMTEKERTYLSLNNWYNYPDVFFFSDKSDLSLPKIESDELVESVAAFKKGQLRYFHGLTFNINCKQPWLTNPQSGYIYEKSKHWTEIEDLSQEAGDIKFVWERSRFIYLYDFIRYDYYYGDDQSDFVFNEIESWIDANPLNYGPNYICSQEISLRILNWIFVLFYYKKSKFLDEILLNKILHSIYGQMTHVYDNINFSRITVRNNHAITETLTLYLVGLLFPFYENAKRWKIQGKKWFEKEILHQIYEDGTHLQFSFNYHRVVLQLITWALYLARKSQEKFSDEIYKRTKQTLHFIMSHQDNYSGYLPNYGANDGSLFFKLTSCTFRDFRPQINALYYYFHGRHLFDNPTVKEESKWYKKQLNNRTDHIKQRTLNAFKTGGYYTIKEKKSLTFIRCAKYKDRPSHADNLHVDIWYEGLNLFHDCGSYQYNTEQNWITFFNGSAAHNTLQIANHDQMLKGPRFIWYYWSQALSYMLFESAEEYIFSGKIQAFRHIDKKIIHHRIVKKNKSKPEWIIEDNLNTNLNLPLVQNWNTRNEYLKYFRITSYSETGNPLKCVQKKSFYSSTYGVKEPCIQIIFTTSTKTIITKITLMD